MCIADGENGLRMTYSCFTVRSVVFFCCLDDKKRFYFPTTESLKQDVTKKHTYFLEEVMARKIYLEEMFWPVWQAGLLPVYFPQLHKRLFVASGKGIENSVQLVCLQT